VIESAVRVAPPRYSRPVPPADERDTRPGDATAAVRLAPGEPAAGPWRVRSVSDLLVDLGVPSGDPGAGPPPAGPPRVVAIDGRGGAGKTTLARRLRARVPASAVVHTDDVAWHHGFFDWADLLRDGVLTPLKAARPVAYRPAAWEARGRSGAIVVPAGLAVVWLEGTGSLRRDLADVVDAGVWIQSDVVEADRRLVARDGGSAQEERFKRDWDREEIPFMLDHRPWERATAIVDGTTRIFHDPADEIVTAPPVPARA
jgi:hypothetical protein